MGSCFMALPLLKRKLASLLFVLMYLYHYAGHCQREDVLPEDVEPYGVFMDVYKLIIIMLYSRYINLM